MLKILKRFKEYKKVTALAQMQDTAFCYFPSGRITKKESRLSKAGIRYILLGGKK
jgi:hypothetical protein